MALDASREAARKARLLNYHEEAEHQREVYQRLVKWEDRKHKSPLDSLLSWFSRCFSESPRPDNEELKALARHYFPPRAEIKCHVCDYGLGRAEHHVVDLGRIEQYFNVKPDWADVRWIHIQLGQGIVHSSLEDIFLHEGKQGRPFEHAGRTGFPYLMTEIYNFRHRNNFREMRDVYVLLKDRTDLHKDLNESTWKGDHNPSLQGDVSWRAGHLALTPDYWTLSYSDLYAPVSSALHSS